MQTPRIGQPVILHRPAFPNNGTEVAAGIVTRVSPSSSSWPLQGPDVPEGEDAPPMVQVHGYVVNLVVFVDAAPDGTVCHAVTSVPLLEEAHDDLAYVGSYAVLDAPHLGGRLPEA